jgi:hypothetical protein
VNVNIDFKKKKIAQNIKSPQIAIWQIASSSGFLNC